MAACWRYIKILTLGHGLFNTSVACRSVVQKIAVDGAALPQTFSKPQFWYTNTCANALRFAE